MNVRNNTSSSDPVALIKTRTRNVPKCFIGFLLLITIVIVQFVDLTSLNRYGTNDDISSKIHKGIADNTTKNETTDIEKINPNQAVNTTIETKSNDPIDNSRITIEAIENETMITDNTSFTTRPPLDTLIDKGKNVIIGNVSFILDFAILGFAKCGTSTMMNWLWSHSSEIKSFNWEQYDLLKRKPDKLVQKLYNRLPPDTDTVQYRRGYKSPSEIKYKYVLEYFRTIFPSTKIIIGTRHPVRWFESMYNFRVQNKRDPMPHPLLLIGRCRRNSNGCCTQYTNFASSLMRLWKPNVLVDDDDNVRPIPINSRRPLTELEEKIFEGNRSETEPVLNPIFLFELNQLSDKNTTRADQFRIDVQQFLNLKSPLPDMVHSKPGKPTQNQTLQDEKDRRKINICDDQYQSLRDELMMHARDTSLWIRTVFLNSPTVYYSSREYLDEIFVSWMIDPCTVNRTLSSTSPTAAPLSTIQEGISSQTDA